MNEMKNLSFWKSLEIVLAGARLPDRQMTNPWPIVRLEGIVDLPLRLPKRAAPAEREGEGDVNPASTAGAGAGVVARPPPRRFSHGFLPE